MTATNRKVLDISHHNTVTSWASVRAAGIVGIIHKASESDYYIDDAYADNVAEARKAGLLWGAYHFADGVNVKDQVDLFLNVTGIHDDMLYALDWEDDPGGNTMSRAQAQEFLELIERQTGRKAVIYSGNVAKEALGDDEDAYFGAHRMWIAQYGSSPVVQPSWDDYWLWQYSDGNVGPELQGCPGVTGDVDTNSWPGTDEELRTQWTGMTERPPRPPRPRTPVVKIAIQEQGAIVLVNGRLLRTDDAVRSSASRHE